MSTKIEMENMPLFGFGMTSLFTSHFVNKHDTSRIDTLVDVFTIKNGIQTPPTFKKYLTFP